MATPNPNPTPAATANAPIEFKTKIDGSEVALTYTPRSFSTTVEILKFFGGKEDKLCAVFSKFLNRDAKKNAKVAYMNSKDPNRKAVLGLARELYNAWKLKGDNSTKDEATQTAAKNKAREKARAALGSVSLDL